MKYQRRSVVRHNGAWLMVCMVLVAVLLLSILAAVSFGTMYIPLEQVYQVILHELFGIGDPGLWGKGGIHDVVWLIRLPRILLALGVGMGLSVCGVVMQAIVKNPLADPYILGVSSGAYLGASLAMLLGAGTALGGASMGLFGCIGAFVVSCSVMALANLGGRVNAVKLLLAGAAMSAICSGFSNLFIYILNDDHAATAVVQWSMGSLAGADWAGNAVILPVVDDAAITLGTNLPHWRLLYLTVSALLVGFVVYKAGLIGFVGLIIPHMVRMFFGTDHKRLIPLSALSGAVFLLWADVLCRIILPGNELPIGILTALIGAPVFAYLMINKSYGFGGSD